MPGAVIVVAIGDARTLMPAAGAVRRWRRPVTLGLRGAALDAR